MGEIADSILFGEMCETCGEWLGEGDGYPRKCAGCSGQSSPKFEMIPCIHPGCKKKFKTYEAMQQHYRDRHTTRKK